jgi:hypothetical protein
LVESGGKQDDASQHAAGARHHAGQQPGLFKTPLQRDCDEAETCPYHEIAGEKEPA